MSTFLNWLKSSHLLRYVTVVSFFLYVAVPGHAGASRRVRIPSSSMILVALVEDANSGTLQPGATVALRAVGDLAVGNDVLIAAGAPGSAKVSSVKKGNFLGIPGQLTLTAMTIQAVDGTTVPITGTTQAQGEDKMILAIALAVFVCLVGVFIKGGDAVLVSNTQFQAYVAGSPEIETK